jgi:hypothetical protein
VSTQTAPRHHPSERQRRPLALLALAPIAAALAAAALAAASERGFAGAALTFRTSHYLCYEAKSPEGFAQRSVVVLDQFKQRRKTVVTGIETVCTPASKNGSRVLDKQAHLVCYRTKSAQSFRTRRVVVTNQFGKARLAVVKPASLCLPSAKSLGPTTVAPPIPKTIPHFQCYPVKPLTTTKPRKVKVVDQFGGGGYAVTRPVALCNPASKNGSRVVNPREHLVCYLVDPLQAAKTRKVIVTNQFGTAVAVMFAATRLCLPSLKQEIV